MIKTKSEKLHYNVFDAVMKIGKAFDDIKISDGKMVSKMLGEDIKKVRSYLDCTLAQILLFCVIFAICQKKDYTDSEEVESRLGITEESAKNWEGALRGLVDKNLLVPHTAEKEKQDEFDILKYLDEFNKNFFKVNPALVQSIKNNERCTRILMQEKSAFTLIEKFDSDFLEHSRKNQKTMYDLQERTEQFEREYLPSDICKNLKENLSTEERTFLYALCWQQIHDEQKTLHETLANLYSENFRTIKTKEYELAREESNLLKLGYIKTKTKKFCKGPCVKVTNEGLKAVFGEESKLVEENENLSSKKKRNVTIIAPSEIEQKELFFSNDMKEQLSDLCQGLERENFSEIQKRLSEHKFAKGVCCILYGAPGTGKTECVYQIAKATGRSVYKVDAGQIRARYVGESEKNTKRIFTEYEKFCRRCRAANETVPILLLNEADGLFSKRLSIEGKNSTIQQMENTMQNIILEQMEKFEGIMIATTNLQDGFDEAFDRRFLFKVEFKKPTAESRMMIWQSKMEGLPKDELKRLAERYDFSGGEIDNIVRRAVMRTIITARNATFEEIDELCKNERLRRTKDKVVGFGR